MVFGSDQIQELCKTWQGVKALKHTHAHTHIHKQADNFTLGGNKSRELGQAIAKGSKTHQRIH